MPHLACLLNGNLKNDGVYKQQKHEQIIYGHKQMLSVLVSMVFFIEEHDFNYLFEFF